MPRGRRLDVRTRPFRPPRGPEASGRRVCAGTRSSPSASTASCSRAPRRARTTSASACATTEASGGAAGRMRHAVVAAGVVVGAARSPCIECGGSRLSAHDGLCGHAGPRRQSRCSALLRACDVSSRVRSDSARQTLACRLAVRAVYGTCWATPTVTVVHIIWTRPAPIDIYCLYPYH